MKERLQELWEQATGLAGDRSPLARAIISECLEASEGSNMPWEDISDAMGLLNIDIKSFKRLLNLEQQAVPHQCCNG